MAMVNLAESFIRKFSKLFSTLLLDFSSSLLKELKLTPIKKDFRGRVGAKLGMTRHEQVRLAIANNHRLLELPNGRVLAG